MLILNKYGIIQRLLFWINPNNILYWILSHWKLIHVYRQSVLINLEKILKRTTCVMKLVNTTRFCHLISTPITHFSPLICKVLAKLIFAETGTAHRKGNSIKRVGKVWCSACMLGKLNCYSYFLTYEIIFSFSSTLQVHHNIYLQDYIYI